MVAIWGDRVYPAIRFEYKTVSERHLVAEIYAKQFKVFRKNSEFQFFLKTPKTVLLITQQPKIAQRPFCILHISSFSDLLENKNILGITLASKQTENCKKP